MNPLVWLKQRLPGSFLILLLACFAALDETQAVDTDPQDYFPNFNTGAGQGALFNLRNGAYNSAFGLFSLQSLLDGSYNTAVGAGSMIFNTADRNTAIGAAALLSNTAGEDNTAIGTSALSQNVEGNWNTAVGSQALGSNTGDDNTATGFRALVSNTQGNSNTAVGSMALFSNADGNQNTAIGVGALQTSTSSSGNTANGAFALSGNTDGSQNTAIGVRALQNNTIGAGNTANGWSALGLNTTGGFNVAFGWDALGSNTTGGGNTALGYGALFTNTTGSNNTVLGAFAGKGVTTANNVICIGNGVLGADIDNSTWIAGIWGETPQSGNTAPVVVSDGGQLGVVASSKRYKKDIATMKNASEVILSLRPVTFHYKSDAKETPQFGLIAEEVAKVNPALVLSDKDGKPFTVRYDAVNAMLLNEFLKEHQKVETLEAALDAVKQRLAEQDAKIQKVSAQLELSKTAPQTVVNNQ